MTINEALAKVGTLKGELARLERLASQGMTTTQYLGVNDQYYTNVDELKIKENALLEQIVSLVAKIHNLKIAIQEVNHKRKINILIQELDYWKTICTLLAPYRGQIVKSPPQLAGGGFGSSNPVYIITQANFDFDRVERLYQMATTNIDSIKNKIQQMNCETGVTDINYFKKNVF
jgi:hypothetical protein